MNAVGVFSLSIYQSFNIFFIIKISRSLFKWKMCENDLFQQIQNEKNLLDVRNNKDGRPCFLFAL